VGFVVCDIYVNLFVCFLASSVHALVDSPSGRGDLVGIVSDLVVGGPSHCGSYLSGICRHGSNIS
jgi:hypothetical protein